MAFWLILGPKEIYETYIQKSLASSSSCIVRANSFRKWCINVLKDPLDVDKYLLHHLCTDSVLNCSTVKQFYLRVYPYSNIDKTSIPYLDLLLHAADHILQLLHAIAQDKASSERRLNEIPNI